jgi:hypothetical protein
MSKVTLNDKLAVLCTKGFGTMWMFYGLALYGLMALIPAFRPFQDTLLYWSNFVQLISLPLLLVGTNILGRAAEARARYDHAKLTQTYEETKIIYDDILAVMRQQEVMVRELSELSCHPRNLKPIAIETKAVTPESSKQPEKQPEAGKPETKKK